jgi:predicted TIM-barrel fold metal-dependent hydrolase
VQVIDFRVVTPWTLFFEAGEPVRDQWPERARGYEHVLGIGDETLRLTVDDLDAVLRQADIRHAVVHAEYVFGNAHTLNVATANAVQKLATPATGFATVDPRLGAERALRDLHVAFDELGLRGVNVQAWALETKPDNRRLYPIYAECARRGFPVAIHTGVNYSVGHSFGYGHPMALDRVACDFPSLTVVANHSGWPWTLETLALARKHPNVYLELGGLSPKYVAQLETGWGPFVRLARSPLQDKVLFASDWPAIQPGRSLAELRDWPVPDTVMDKICHKNAERVLGL